MKKETLERIRKFSKERNWKQFHTPANICKSIVIESSELLENFQWTDDPANIDNIEEELADVLIYCTYLVDYYNLDVDSIINSKIDQNELKYPVEKSKGNADKYTKF